MAQFLLNLVTEFAGPFVDLLISSFDWKREERSKLQELKKQLLVTLDDTIYYLVLPRNSLSIHRDICKQWHHLVVDLESYAYLEHRVEGFARAIEEAPSWNRNKKLVLALRLNAFKGSVRRTSSGDLRNFGKTIKRKKRATKVQIKAEKLPQRKPNAEKRRKLKKQRYQRCPRFRLVA
jgi:hypothetical protein